MYSYCIYIFYNEGQAVETDHQKDPSRPVLAVQRGSQGAREAKEG